MNRKIRLVLIEWEDSVLGFQGWKFISEQPKNLTRFTSVGFLVHEDKNCVILYPHIENVMDFDSMTGSGDIKIPKSAIIKRKVLKYG